MLKNWLILSLTIITLWLGIIPISSEIITAKQLAWADTIQENIRGDKIFEINCVGCHPGGGNIIRRGKNLKLNTLKKHQLNTVETLVTYITKGERNMPAFQDRLTQPEIVEVANFLLEKAQNNWK